MCYVVVENDKEFITILSKKHGLLRFKKGEHEQGGKRISGFHAEIPPDNLSEFEAAVKNYEENNL